MKKLYAIMVILAIATTLAGCAAGSAEDTALAAQYLPDGVEFVKSEYDDGFTEYEYRTDTGDEYSLLVGSADTVRALKFDSKSDSTASEVSISSEEAFAKVTEQYPEAQLITAVEERDDGHWEWNILFSVGNMLGFYEIDAARGLALDYTIFYAINESIDPTTLIAANISDARIVGISLDAEDGRLIITGNAVSASGKIEFAIDADTGIITEFDFDN